MAIVKENPNGDKGTVEGMAKYSFQSSPPEQFEHIPTPGERRVMSVVVQCKQVIDEEVDEGIRKHVKWKVVEAEIGTMAKRAATDSNEPELPYDGEGDGADYGDYPADASPDESDGDTADSDDNVHQMPSFSAGE